MLPNYLFYFIYSTFDCLKLYYSYTWLLMMVLAVRNLPADREDPLEKKMATHSSILVWEIPWTEEPGGLQSLGS